MEAMDLDPLELEALSKMHPAVSPLGARKRLARRRDRQAGSAHRPGQYIEVVRMKTQAVNLPNI